MSTTHWDELQSELDEVIQSGELPVNVQAKARSLLAELKSPIKLTIIGSRQSGKSTLVNLLLGRTLFPENNGLPTMQIVKGAVVNVTCTRPDGTKQSFDHFDADTIRAANPIMVDVEAPLETLDKISVLEMVLPDDFDSQVKAIKWADKRSDIILWCTQKFSPTEQALWNSVSEAHRQNAFLMLTKADVLNREGVLKEQFKRLKGAAGGVFQHVLPLNTLGAVAAQSADGGMNETQMTSTGARSVMTALWKSTAACKQHVADQIDALLSQHDQFSSKMISQPAPKKAVAPKRAAPEPAAQVVVEPTVIELEPKVEAPVQAVVPVKPTPAAVPVAPETRAVESSQVVALFPDNRQLYQDAVAQITELGAELQETAEQGDLGDDMMLSVLEKIQWLNEHLEDNGNDEDPIHQEVMDTLADAADISLLLEIEVADHSPMDAISLLVQLKRDLECRMCA